MRVYMYQNSNSKNKQKMHILCLAQLYVYKWRHIPQLHNSKNYSIKPIHVQ